jgi:dihydrofolate reductase
MAKLLYSAITSLDGYVADSDGNFDWAAPDSEVHAFVNETERAVGTQLLGRRMYEFMVPWETWELEGESPEIVDWATLWRGLDKIVYSRTLEEPRTARTRIEREFDPVAVRSLKASASRDVSIGGPELAGQAIRAGLVDELHLFMSPIVVGGGTAALPDGARWDLELVAERRFGNGVVFLHYRAR